MTDCTDCDYFVLSVMHILKYFIVYGSATVFGVCWYWGGHSSHRNSQQHLLVLKAWPCKTTRCHWGGRQPTDGSSMCLSTHQPRYMYNQQMAPPTVWFTIFYTIYYTFLARVLFDLINSFCLIQRRESFYLETRRVILAFVSFAHTCNSDFTENL